MNARTLTMRKGVVALVAGGTLLAISPMVAGAVTSDEDPPPEIAAKGAKLLDVKSGESLFDQKADTALPMASTAKIMVASVVLDSKKLDLERKIPVRKEYRDYVAKHHTSTADLQTGDKITISQLLHAALLPSGADAAYALADTFGTGDTRAERVDSFIGKMNAKARQLGLPKTKFETFDGTSNDSSTPEELARLARHALKNETFRTIVKIKKFKTEAPAANGNTRYYTWTNTNQLLGSYDGVFGVKTGTTTKAGSCLVFSATRDGKTVIGTILNSKDRYDDAAKLLDYAFGSDEAKDLKIRELPEGAQRD